MARWAPDHDGKVDARKRGLGRARVCVQYQIRYNHRISKPESSACIGKSGRGIRDQSAPTMVPQATVEATHRHVPVLPRLSGISS